MNEKLKTILLLGYEVTLGQFDPDNPERSITFYCDITHPADDSRFGCDTASPDPLLALQEAVELIELN